MEPDSLNVVFLTVVLPLEINPVPSESISRFLISQSLAVTEAPPFTITVPFTVTLSSLTDFVFKLPEMIRSPSMVLLLSIVAVRV